MAIWVCRTGALGEYEAIMRENQQIYLTRGGYRLNLKESDKGTIIDITQKLAAGSSRQTISNIWSQIDIFANRMAIGDLVIIPRKGKYEISIARIKSDYKYVAGAVDSMLHQRDVEFIKNGIDTTKFPKDIFYSLGAFRAVFSIKQEARFLAILRKWGIE